MKCIVESCENKAEKGQMCRSCYDTVRALTQRHGHLVVLRRGEKLMTGGKP